MPAERLGIYHVHGPTLEIVIHAMDSKLVGSSRSSTNMAKLRKQSQTTSEKINAGILFISFDGCKCFLTVDVRHMMDVSSARFYRGLMMVCRGLHTIQQSRAQGNPPVAGRSNSPIHTTRPFKRSEWYARINLLTYSSKTIFT
ncbi:unnamed protein product [Protopolystoma xenopodis]|uniref:Uncharacterized protein n=1 Tax=Protopolystoma xenopodis TaxID=117903 RepID=A0A448WS20_9PLAT|nr:unnamed protein product [Protopolystoma xenopodis]